jgi:antitoxin component of MazEF toxin-antitoxin module
MERPTPMSNRVRVQRHPYGMLSVSIPRALAQALQIQKHETFEWRLEGGELVLRRLGMLPKRAP